MDHVLQVNNSNYQKISRGILTFLIVDNFNLDIQTGEIIGLKSRSGNGSISVEVVHTSNVHLQVNHLAIGFKLVGDLTDSETFSQAYVSPDTRLSISRPKYEQHRCANIDDMNRKFELLDLIEKDKALAEKNARGRKIQHERHKELREIDRSYVGMISLRGENG